MTRTYVFVLIVENLEDNYDDAGKIGRLRNWFSLDEATKKLSEHKPVQQEYIDKLCQDKVTVNNLLIKVECCHLILPMCMFLPSLFFRIGGIA